MKRKWLAVGIILLFVGTCIVPGSTQDTEKPLPASSGNWLYVGGSGPGNYTTIQSAIDDANPGDTVYVYSGTYTGNLVINKTIDLIGEDRDTTVIDGGGTTESVVRISSDGVMISRFTVQNGLYGIHLDYSSNNTIMDNNASHNDNSGIYLHYSSNNTIMDNNVSHNEWAGIHLYNSSNNNIMGNNAHSNTGYGIFIDYSYDNIIKGNNVHSNTDFGIFLSFYSYDNIIEGNNVHSNTAYGIFLYYCYNNIIDGNNVYSNTDIGIVLFSCSSNNHFYHNNLINNSQNAYDQGGSNTWDNGYPSGGNYWSDYTGTDNNGDGIGDTPYNIPGGSIQDLYPFMESNGWLNEPPVADFSWAIVNLFAHFNASSSYDVDGYITTWFWEFGDGTVETGEIVNHIYHSSGIYNVTLTVTDDDGEQDNIVQEFTITYISQNLTAFIFGKITNLSHLEEFILFRAERILMVTFSPFDYSGIQGTRFIISNEYQGLVGGQYIFVLCKILCDY